MIVREPVGVIAAIVPWNFPLLLTCWRGALLDLFPMGSELPYRLDFFDDEIDSLRVFDVDSQRTLEEVEAINLRHRKLDRAGVIAAIAGTYYVSRYNRGNQR